ncbi:MAG: hypothetical protein AABY87_02300 [bacterium]
MNNTNARYRIIAMGLILAAFALGGAVTLFPLPTGAQNNQHSDYNGYHFIPMTLEKGQTLYINYFNRSILNASVVMSLVDAESGALLAGGKVISVPPGQGEVSDSYTNNGDLPISIFGVLQLDKLAEPRPDPIASMQLTGSAGTVALAEPRPDPILASW